MPTFVVLLRGVNAVKHAAYLHCASGIVESKAGEALLGKAGTSATTRNWATTLKLYALTSESGA
jgi:uncharacterized protein (DUF1697 family)